MSMRRTRRLALTGAVLFLLAWAATSEAGNLEPPPGPPAPTMKSLDEVPPTWSQALPAASRFVAVLGGHAYLDRETGLVWTTTGSGSNSAVYWNLAYSVCANLYVPSNSRPGLFGWDRMGWRLPARDEVQSNFDFGFLQGPFTDMPAYVWTSSEVVDSPGEAWAVKMNAFFFQVDGGYAYGLSKSATSYNSSSLGVWCVRGPGGGAR